MVYSFDGFNYLVRLDKGESLEQALKDFAQDSEIEGAWVNAIGGALEVTLGFYDPQTKQYSWQKFEGAREILNLTGNIAFDEQANIILHLHGTFGNQNYQTIGGHVKDLIAAATVEIFVHRAYKPTKRKASDQAGLKVLDL